MLLLGDSSNGDIVNISKGVFQFVIVNNIVDGTLEHSHSISNSKMDSTELVELAIPFEGCVGLLFLSYGDLMVGRLQIQGAINLVSS